LDLGEPLFKRLVPMHDYLVSDEQRPDASRIQPLGLVWWKPELIKQPATKRALIWWSEGGSQPQAVMRSSWNDPKATFIGIKAGSANNSHGHMDVGSFVIEANGVRWAVDLGRDGYTLPRQHGLGEDLFLAAQESKRWSMFCNGSDSHNILRFNGATQWVDGKSELTPVVEKSLIPGYKMDLTPIYAGQMDAVQRGFSLRPDKSIFIQDEWHAGSHGAAVTWQMITYASVELKKNEIVLTQAGETLRLLVISKDIAHLSVQNATGLLNVWDRDHPGLKRLTIRINTLPKSDGRLAIIADPTGKAEPVNLDKLIPLSKW
jgi:oligo-alginate lyase